MSESSTKLKSRPRLGVVQQDGVYKIVPSIEPPIITRLDFGADPAVRMRCRRVFSHQVPPDAPVGSQHNGAVVLVYDHQILAVEALFTVDGSDEEPTLVFKILEGGQQTITNPDGVPIVWVDENGDEMPYEIKIDVERSFSHVHYHTAN